MDAVDQALMSVASLGDPLRRRLYRLVVDHGTPVGREEASRAVGVSRSLAAYHLDRLVDEGLLEVRFERLGTRRGPGAGRPAKLYERSRRQFAVQLPPRHYDLAAAVLAEAIADRADPALLGRIRDRARQLGRAVAAAATATATATVDGDAPAGSGDGPLAALCGCGYEPVDDDGVIRFRNCPFDTLARDHRELICGMNLALVEGLLDESGAVGVEAVLDPRPDRCCVALRPSAP